MRRYTDSGAGSQAVFGGLAYRSSADGSLDPRLNGRVLESGHAASAGSLTRTGRLPRTCTARAANLRR